MQIVPAFAYLMPVVILFSVGPAAAVVSTMIYAIPPAVRITALGIRGVAVEHGRGGGVDGGDPPADARQGAAAARAPDAAARRQPDDPVRALDGRDRGPDRRRRARRRRHERALLEPGARDPRRVRDRDHGDGARPRDRGDREPHRPGEAAPRRRRPQAAAPLLPRRRRSRRRRRRRLEARGRLRRCTRTRRRAASRRDGPGVAARPDPEGARLRAEPDVVGVPHHRADRQLPAHQGAAPAAGVPRRDALVRHRRRADADRARRQRDPAGA